MPPNWTRRSGDRTGPVNHSLRQRPSDADPFGAPSSGFLEKSGGNPFTVRPSTSDVNPFSPPGLSTPAAESPATTSPTHQYRSPSPRSGPTVSNTKPLAVLVAYIALLTAAILAVTLTGVWVYLLTEFRQTVNNAMDVDPSGMVKLFVTDYADDAQLYLTAAVIVLGAVLASGYVAVARAIRKGRRWPRAVCPVLALLSLPAVFLGHIAIIIVAAGLIATAAAWTPTARAFSSGRRRPPR